MGDRQEVKRSNTEEGDERRKITLRIFEKGMKKHASFLHLKLHIIHINVWAGM